MNLTFFSIWPTISEILSNVWKIIFSLNVFSPLSSEYITISTSIYAGRSACRDSSGKTAADNFSHSVQSRIGTFSKRIKSESTLGTLSGRTKDINAGIFSFFRFAFHFLRSDLLTTPVLFPPMHFLINEPL